jgi:hypothetical protein
MRGWDFGPSPFRHLSLVLRGRVSMYTGIVRCRSVILCRHPVILRVVAQAIEPRGAKLASCPRRLTLVVGAIAPNRIHSACLGSPPRVLGPCIRLSSRVHKRAVLWVAEGLRAGRGPWKWHVLRGVPANFGLVRTVSEAPVEVGPNFAQFPPSIGPTLVQHRCRQHLRHGYGQSWPLESHVRASYWDNLDVLPNSLVI